MSRFVRRAAKRDAAEPDIVKALEDIGAQVYQLDQPCDLAVLFRERWWLLEVETLEEGKTGPATAKRKKRKTPGQIKQAAFLLATGTPVVRTPLDALKAIGAFTQGAALTGFSVTPEYAR